MQGYIGFETFRYIMYDYLLVNKPIGLCWEDIEEYKELEGIIFNDYELEKVTKGCSKIYTCGELLPLIETLKNISGIIQSSRN